MSDVIWSRAGDRSELICATVRPITKATQRMSFERIEPGTPEWVAYYANHIHRYEFAVEKLKIFQDVHVLDVACGVGYGAKYIAEGCGATVVATDRDEKALHIGSAHFPHASVTFCRDDCPDLIRCEKYAPFDAVVSFETVEHLPEASLFLTKCRQMTRRDGLFLISTPNIRATNSRSSYHLKEYSAPELVTLLHTAGFDDVQLYGQQLTSIGKLKRDIREELNRLASNPFVRCGRWLQRVLRNVRSPRIVLPDTKDDFEIVPMSPPECQSLGAEGPFVLICSART